MTLETEPRREQLQSVEEQSRRALKKEIVEALREADTIGGNKALFTSASVLHALIKQT